MGTGLFYYPEAEARVCRRKTLFLGIQQPIQHSVAQDGLDVLAGLGEWDRLHELLSIVVAAAAAPLGHPVLAGVVRGQGIVNITVVVIHDLFEVTRAQLQVGSWLQQLVGRKMRKLNLSG